MRAQLETARYQGLATFAQRPFVASVEELAHSGAEVAIVGAPWDGSSYYRPGSRFGPRALRTTVFSPGTYHIDLDLEIFETIAVVDYGDALCRHGLVEASHAAIRSRVHDIAALGIKPVVLGGDHSITWPAATAVAEVVGFGDLGLVHFDAHADTAESVEGNLASHGSPMRRLIESGAVPGQNFVQIGLRGYWPPAKVFAWMRQQGMEWHLMSEIRRVGLRAILTEALQKLSATCKAIYMSVDIDVLDPAFAPGTGTPEPGGMQVHELLAAVRFVAMAAPLVAVDVVEVSPPYDWADVTANSAQRVVMEVLAGLAGRKLGRPAAEHLF